MLYLEKKRIKNWAMMLLHMRMFAPKERDISPCHNYYWSFVSINQKASDVIVGC